MPSSPGRAIYYLKSESLRTLDLIHGTSTHHKAVHRLPSFSTDDPGNRKIMPEGYSL